MEGVWKLSGRCLKVVNFLGPKFFRKSNSFSTQIFSGHKIQDQKFFRLDPFSVPTFYWNRNFLGPKFFQDISFFWNTKFLGPKIFCSTYFLDHKMFGTQHKIFISEFFRDPNILGPEIFWKFLYPNYFGTKIFSGPQYFVTQFF